MKKIIALLMAMTMLFALAACGGNDSSPAPAGSTAAEPEASAEATEIAEASETAAEKTEYAIGETWTVDGQWSLTITSVEETADRNQYSEKNPAAVYIVNYTYTNLGFEDETGYWDGLYIGLDDTIIDSENVLGYSYPGNITNYAQETPVDVTCNAQECIGVDHAGSFKLKVSIYDSTNTKQTATFVVDVPEA